ncbi:hypothetical protein NNJEOMEG_01743 [Fundidesulfovibrio magnetotacticus]|uniref:Acyltransferase 3 domain-containing protein n=1 Tax=Fundidesulfovibrio magnetotacticus TaxID=2730080 RepID=A0A6V8M0A5_9BACT|nr:hypothetical protein NNJEOMEG_01743 [Fundidesulfovibrio magnetotacticus]
MTSQRYPHLDLLRATSIFYIVMIWHFDNYLPIHIFDTTPFEITTYTLLALFMYISGFLLSARNTISNFNDFLLFYQKRFIRIYPLFILALTLFYLTGMIDANVFFHAATLTSIITNDQPITLWFITCIIAYYLIFPVIIYRYSFAHCTISAAFAIIILVTISKLNSALVDKRAIVYLIPFTFGIISNRSAMVRKYTAKYSVVVPLFVAGILATCVGYNCGTESISRASSTAAIPLIILLSSKIYAQNCIITAVSYASYCMYLYHRVIFMYVVEVIPIHNPALNIFMLFVVGFISIFAISYAIQYTYDSLVDLTRKKRNVS